MKKVVFSVVFGLILFLIPVSAFAEEVHIYLFYGNTCPLCEDEREFLKSLTKKYSDVKVFEYETFDDSLNEERMNTVKNMYHISGRGVPLAIVGDTAVYGYNDANRKKIENAVERYLKEDYYDRVGVYLRLFEDEEIVVSSSIPVSSFEEDNSKNDRSLSWNLVCLLAGGFVLVFGTGTCFILRKFGK